MDIGIVVSLILGIGSMIVAFVAEGGSLGSLLQPTAALIVFGGTIGAVGVSFTGEDLKKIGKIVKIAFSKKKINLQDQIDFFKDLSSKTRKNGFLSLESEINGSDIDPFIKKGLQMVIDGAEPNIIRNALEIRMENILERHAVGSAIFEAAGVMDLQWEL